ncbi:sensor histidine kinase [Runella aurantiaca]|uniref:Histidine kinase n=1 Tax=Runella aurantiaca TaxID=2282308 RepID=A0A369I1A2_9BACT|nr:histidine kinase [Runella aurantiaca]RDB03549.1 histidine kinase [Runella aurantiaca]
MKSFPYSRLVFLLLTVTFSGYLGLLLYISLKTQFGNDGESLSGFGKFLASYVLLVAGVWTMGWLNYRGPFQWWFLASEKRWWYWTWIVALTWLVFELLQFRQDREPEFVDESSLITLVLMGLIIVFGYIADAFRARRERLVLQQQKTEAELTALKSQINPHFLFNTLNTIYNEAAGADNDTVADLVQQLAGIMRFTLQESAKPYISIESELAFLDKYLTLQRARLPHRDSIRLDIHIDYDGQPAQIAPLLLIPFVENAFQYGISMEHPCFIRMKLYVENQTLDFYLQNSTIAKEAHRKGHGVGIANVQQRLKLLYAHRHTLKIKEETGVFEIHLQLELY